MVLKKQLFLVLLLFSLASWAQTDVRLDSIVVSAKAKNVLLKNDYKLVKVITKKEIEQLPVSNIAQLLNVIGNIDVKYRGSGLVQADLSLNGGSFNDVLILINGVKYIDYQTGHFNFNLPISLDIIDRIEILLAPDSRRYGVNSFSGAINIITKTADQSIFNTKLGLFQQNLKPIIGFNLVDITKKNLGIMAITANIEQSQGYEENTDYKSYKFFTTRSFETKHFSLFLQGGLLINKFGALNFYTPRFPWQYEENNAQFLSAKMSFKKNLEVSFSWRRHQDKFELFREGENWYHFDGTYFIRGNDTAILAPGVYYQTHNYHANNLFSFTMDKMIISKAGQTFLSLQTEYYSIHSTVMGDTLSKQIKIPFEEDMFFTKGAYRYNIVLSANHLFSFKNLTLSTGFSQIYNSQFGLIYTGGMDFNYLISPNISFIAGANKTARFPTFTEMYYRDPIHIANANLRPQQKWAFNSGIRFMPKNLFLDFYGFYAKNIGPIEWVMDENTGIYYSENLTDFISYGLNTSLRLSFPKQFVLFDKFFVSYTYLDYRDFSYPLSKYTANLTHHNLSAIAYIKLWQTPKYKMNFIYNIEYKQRFINVIDDTKKDFMLNNMSIIYSTEFMDLQFSLRNIFNVQWSDYYTPMPGRTFLFNIKFKL